MSTPLQFTSLDTESTRCEELNRTRTGHSLVTMRTGFTYPPSHPPDGHFCLSVREHYLVGLELCTCVCVCVCVYFTKNFVPLPIAAHGSVHSGVAIGLGPTLYLRFSGDVI